MKIISLVLLTLLWSSSLWAKADDDQKISKCLQRWGEHPFAQDNPQYKTLEAGTTVMGFGSGGIDDHVATEQPALILVKSAPGFLSNITNRLMNPNGWYCLDSSINIMGNKSTELDCRANLAQSQGTIVFKGNGIENFQATHSGDLELVNCKALPGKARFFSLLAPYYTSAFNFGFGSTYHTSPDNLAGNDGHQAFSLSLDFGYYLYFHTSFRYTADYLLTDRRDVLSPNRHFRFFLPTLVFEASCLLDIFSRLQGRATF